LSGEKNVDAIMHVALSLSVMHCCTFELTFVDVTNGELWAVENWISGPGDKRLDAIHKCNVKSCNHPKRETSLSVATIAHTKRFTGVVLDCCA
jgi:hypothetical protein